MFRFLVLVLLCVIPALDFAAVPREQATNKFSVGRISKMLTDRLQFLTNTMPKASEAVNATTNTTWGASFSQEKKTLLRGIRDKKVTIGNVVNRLTHALKVVYECMRNSALEVCLEKLRNSNVTAASEKMTTGQEVSTQRQSTTVPQDATSDKGVLASNDVTPMPSNRPVSVVESIPTSVPPIEVTMGLFDTTTSDVTTGRPVGTSNDATSNVAVGSPNDVKADQAAPASMNMPAPPPFEIPSSQQLK